MNDAYIALKHTLEILGLSENDSQCLRDNLYTASSKNISMWGFAVESDGSWANLWYPGNVTDLHEWDGVMQKNHPNARYFRWNGSVIFEDTGPNVFFTRLYYDMPNQK